MYILTLLNVVRSSHYLFSSPITPLYLLITPFRIPSLLFIYHHAIFLLLLKERSTICIFIN
ncbi:hypothetical protein RhiirC2_195216 [Rhizophagus irregularis]|uniref:Uncharacterized protein n=1 Tax=Rhizophagus irregularis TaxID=588596 RepID=A0A2N1MJX9_9GLOM|nr:hypothetical protein RhiirC2_195216 [Rhizophagus irregularis]